MSTSGVEQGEVKSVIEVFRRMTIADAAQAGWSLKQAELFERSRKKAAEATCMTVRELRLALLQIMANYRD